MLKERIWNRKGRTAYDIFRLYLCSTTIRCFCVWLILVMVWNYFTIIWIMEVRIAIPNQLHYARANNVSKHIFLQAGDSSLNFPFADIGLVARLAYKVSKKVEARNVIIRNRNKSPRPKFCKGCFDIKFRYLIENLEVCSEDASTNDSVSTLMLVFTKHGNNIQRRALRNTWLSTANGTIRYNFILGKSTRKSDNELIEIENKNYGDILLVDFIDSYSNLTYKTISAFKWALSVCTHVKYIMKVDDDMWVNMKKLQRMTKTNVFKGRLTGQCNFGSRPFRDPFNKYYVSYAEYSEDFYPPYCSGTAYVIDKEVAQAIVNVSKNIPFFPLEDIYIALCLREIRGRVKSMKPFHSWKVYPTACLYQSDIVLTSHGLSPTELQRMWNTECKSGIRDSWVGRAYGAGPIQQRGRRIYRKFNNGKKQVQDSKLRRNPRYIPVVNSKLKRGRLRPLHSYIKY